MSLKLDADYNHMNINTESSRISFSRNTRSRALCVRANPTEKTLPWSRSAEADDAGGEEDEDDSALLAAPGRRSSDGIQTTTPASKGKMYTPKTFNGKPQNGGDRRAAGASKRSTKGSWSNETGKNTRRNTHKGASDIMGLVKNPLSESLLATNYDEEERNIFSLNNEMERLIEQLGRNKNESEEKK